MIAEQEIARRNKKYYEFTTRVHAEILNRTVLLYKRANSGSSKYSLTNLIIIFTLAFSFRGNIPCVNNLLCFIFTIEFLNFVLRIQV